MANIKLSNFGKQNTPPLIQKIGDAALLSAAVGASILGLPAAMAAAGIVLVFPPLVLAIGGYLTTFGIFGKLLTKFAGKSEPQSEETINE